MSKSPAHRKGKQQPASKINFQKEKSQFRSNIAVGKISIVSDDKNPTQLKNHQSSKKLKEDQR
jgi:hypothetical protein